ncbi:MAG: DUF4430 domain-containing protein [Candidatus Methanospirare jalkutatii]|nr:DUF4430 domain-containing protein [Candidatus Methanospirare jalkutatii]
MRGRISAALLVIVVVCLAAVVAHVIAQPSPFVICGWVSTSGGEPCDNPAVSISNLNTGAEWQAETNAINYYQLILDSNDVNAGDILRFNASCCDQLKTIEHEVTQSDIDNGGILLNISLETPQEIIWQGDVTLINGTTFCVTAHNSGKEYVVNRTTALGALDAAAHAGGFNYTVSDEWGILFVDSIADRQNEGWSGWMYWVNYPDEPMPMVGAAEYVVEDGDVVTWYWSSMNMTPENSPKVLIINVTVAPNEFDTGRGTYPSIPGTHYGTIIPSRNITVNRIYSYPCAGTGGHIEYVKIWNETTGECAFAQWNGYHIADYHNLSFNTTLTLKKGVIYNYIIKTGSYPQIIHAHYKQVNGGNITCTLFRDANGKEYDDWIPAFRLWYAPAA